MPETPGPGRDRGRRRDPVPPATAQLLAAIVQSSDDAVVATTVEGLVTAWNPAAERLYGYPVEEIAGRHVEALIPPERREEERRLRRRIAAGHAVDPVQTERVRKDGTRVMVSRTLSPITDASGAVVGIATLCRTVPAGQGPTLEAAAVLDAVESAVVCVDADGCIVLVSAGAQGLFDRPRGELLGRPLTMLLPDAGSLLGPRPRGRSAREPDGGPVPGAELTGRRRDGTEFPAEVTLRAVAPGRRPLLCATVRDLSERLEAMARYRLLTENATDVVGAATPEGLLTYVSPASRAILGWEPEEVLGRPIFEFAHPDDLRLLEVAVAGVAAHRPEMVTAELRVRRQDGSHLWVEASARGIPGPDGELRELQFALRDVSERKDAQAALERRALTDPLTGLANRAALMDRLGTALRRLGRSSGYVALLMLDLDGLKAVNDSLGHLVGDQLLVATARRLEGAARPSDTVARLGGDEFAVLVEGLGTARDVTALADRIVTVCREAHRTGGVEVIATASVGVAATDRPSYLPEDLLTEADLALYRAKSRGRDRQELFDHDLQVRATARLAMERVIRRAVEETRLKLHYQPIVDLAGGGIVEAEALLRLTDPELGRLEPASFLEVAGEIGLLARLDAWVQTAAVAQMAAWRSAPAGRGLSRMTVNVAAGDLTDSRFAQRLLERLAAAGVPASSLGIELGEQVVVTRTDGVVAALAGLRAAGVRIGLDDFGTQACSLSQLQRFPLDFVKIAPAFTGQAGVDDRSTAFLESVIRLAHSLELNVVAEGVETEAQRAVLRALGCDRAQGFLFARPLTAAEFGQLLASGP